MVLLKLAGGRGDGISSWKTLASAQTDLKSEWRWVYILAQQRKGNGWSCCALEKTKEGDQATETI